MSYESTQPVRDWLGLVVVLITVIGCVIVMAAGAISRFLGKLKAAIDAVWRERQ